MGLLDKAKDAASKAADTAQEARQAQVERRAEREAAVAALQKWDYKVLYIREGRQKGMMGSGGIESDLKELGKQGWEVTGVIGDRILLERALG
jgi:hypothetical protein